MPHLFLPQERGFRTRSYPCGLLSAGALPIHAIMISMQRPEEQVCEGSVGRGGDRVAGAAVGALAGVVAQEEVGVGS